VSPDAGGADRKPIVLPVGLTEAATTTMALHVGCIGGLTVTSAKPAPPRMLGQKDSNDSVSTAWSA
jgi:hypothetical protein